MPTGAGSRAAAIPRNSVFADLFLALKDFRSAGFDFGDQIAQVAVTFDRGIQ
jgi:hypothetical protein